MTTTGEAVYLEVGNGGYSEIGQGRQQWRRSCRLIKRSLRWKAPWVRPQAVAFASDRMGRPLKAAAFFGPWRPGELVLLGFRKKSSEGLVSGQLLFANVFRAQATSVSDRRCLGRLVWGKSTLAQEVDVGVAEA
jgi:hypothetical protein